MKKEKSGAKVTKRKKQLFKPMKPVKPYKKPKHIGRKIGIGAGFLVLGIVVVYAGLNLYSPVAVAYNGKKNSYIVDKGKTLVSAHRSGGGLFPENTMMALKSCVESQDFKTDIFEFDLHRTKDGRLILLHDDTLDRTTDSVNQFLEEGVKPGDKVYTQLRQLNFGEYFVDEKGAKPYQGLRGEDIPDDLRALALEDALDYLESVQKYSYIIEIKDGGESGYRAVDTLCAVLKERNMFDRVVFGTFHKEVSMYVDQEHPELLRSAGVREVLSFYLNSLINRDLGDKKLPYVALQVPANQYWPARLGTEKFINYAHRYNLAVQYWTINDEAEIRRLAQIGADAIMSDVPDTAYRVIHGGE